MIINLILKEFKNSSFFSKIKKRNFISAIISLVITLSFVVLEISVYAMLNNKISKYDGASEALLIIFLFGVSIVHIIYTSLVVNKTLYNKDDNSILINKPIDPSKTTFAKVMFIYLKNVFNNYFIAYPILVVFIINNKDLSRIHFLAFLYPVIISIFETGLSYLLSIPVHYLERVLKKHLTVRFILTLLLGLVLCVAYYFVLNAFLILVRDNNISSIFSPEMIETFKDISIFLFPTTWYMNIIDHHYELVVLLIFISLVVFALGSAIGSKVYLHNLQNQRETVKRVAIKEKKLVSPFKALLFKEIKILFEDSTSSISFALLLLMQPILTVLVVISMNTIFKTGMLSYVTSYFPYVLPLIQILFIILFAAFVNTSASFALTREKNCLRTLKTIPVSYKKQIAIKLLVPFVSSFVVTLLGILTLFLIGQIDIINALLALAFSITLCALLEIVSLHSDLRHATGEEDSNNSSLVVLASIFLPLALIVLLFLLCFNGFEFYFAFLCSYIVLFILFIMYLFVFLSKANKLFINLEMRN